MIGAALLIGGAVMWAVDALFGPTGTKASIADLAGIATPHDAKKVEIEYEPVTDHEKTTRMDAMSIGQAIWIGACQILSAVFPGTSRSMSTIAGGQIAGLTRSAALEFSFFLSIPTMCVATVFDLWKTIHPGKDLGKDATERLAPLHMNASQWVMLLIGFVVSFIVALGVVAWFMSWVRRKGFAPFAIYRIILGVVVLLWIRTLH